MNTTSLPQLHGSIRQSSAVQLGKQCDRFLAPKTFARAPGGKQCRQRKFPLDRVFWCFIWQVLQFRTSCRAVVRQLQAFCETPTVRFDENTSGYCQARQRLPLAWMQKAFEDSAAAANRLSKQGIPGWTRPVKVVDATGIRMADTDANRKCYRYPSGQKPGCGFPVMKVMGLYSLLSGAMEKVVYDIWYRHDMLLFTRISAALQPGDILLGDRAFCAYLVLAGLGARNIDSVCRLHQARPLPRGRKNRIGPADWLVVWRRPPKTHPSHDKDAWAALPTQITVRIIRSRMQVKGFRTRDMWIATTLLDPQLYPAQSIAELYRRRWDMELCFRDLKTTMGMEEFRCLSPDMVHKELFAYLVAHNLIRCLMAEASSRHKVCRTRISFKGAIDAARSFQQAMHASPSKHQARRLHSRLLEILASDLVPLRLGRCEPRAVKRRPKNYQRLTKHRHLYKETPHRSRYHAIKPVLS